MKRLLRVVLMTTLLTIGIRLYIAVFPNDNMLAGVTTFLILFQATVGAYLHKN